MTSDQLQRVASVLAEAFQHDPMLKWLYPDPLHRRRRLERLYELDVRHRLNGNSIVFRAGNHGIAFWQPPGTDPYSLRASLRLLPALISVVVHHPLKATRAAAEVYGRRPEEPHWVLNHLAVDATQRGRGTGRALVESGLRLADAEGAGAFLETSNPDNLGFYGAAGFEVIDQVDLDGVPTTWLMWRRPSK